MKLGIVSVTFRTLSVDELIDVCKNVEIERSEERRVGKECRL